MNRAGLYIGSLAVVALVVLAGYFLAPAGGDGADGPAAASESATQGSFRAPAALTVPVTAAEAVRGDLVMKITATGTAEAVRLLKVAAEVGGKVEQIAVAEGQKVEAGQLLIALDDTELALRRDQAEEAMINRVMRFANDQLIVPGDEDSVAGRRTESGESAASFLQRMISQEGYQTIREQPNLEQRLKSITREDLFSAQAEFTAQRVGLEMAELNLRRARITAPFAGQVAGIESVGGASGGSWPVVGQQVSPGTDLLLLVDADPIRLRVEVIESEIGRVHVGRRAEVTFTAYPEETFYGTIETISPVVDKERKSLSVTVSLSNADGRLKPGMFAQVTLDTEIFKDRLLVPASAVLLRNQRPLVFIIRDGRAQWQYIEKGRENADWVEVLAGASAGDVVVTGGHFTLAHDTPVSVQKPSEGADDRVPQRP